MKQKKQTQSIVQLLLSKQVILATVESCTGGYISNLITNISGASKVFWGSYVVYDNSAKVSLGVSNEVIQKVGAVSSQVAIELAEQGLKKMQLAIQTHPSYSFSQISNLACLSITGIAGPTGGSDLKPVGLCYIGLALQNRSTIVEEFRASSIQERERVKNEFALRALQFLSLQFDA